MIIHLAVLPLLCLLGFYLMWRIPSFSRCEEETRHSPAKKPPKVSVIIPARNEAQRIRPLLVSLKQQSAPPHEIIVVDDHSTDDTASVASSAGATVVEGKALPNGWTGKTWACWQGAQQASGELLAFLDADVRLESRSLACILDAYERSGGLLTVQPYHRVRRAYEQLSAFFNIVLMAALNAFTLHGDSLRPGGAFGPCLVCSRGQYISIGGHQHRTVRGDVLESIPLARLFLSHDLPVRCLGGRGAVSFRMYPGGLGQLVEGWSKGFGSGALATRVPFLIMVVSWVTGCFSAFIALFDALSWPLTLSVVPFVFIYCLYAFQVWWMLRRIGSFRWWTATLFPIPLCFFALIMLRSFILIHILGRVQWRGRSVRTGRKEFER